MDGVGRMPNNKIAFKIRNYSPKGHFEHGKEAMTTFFA
jgi:hypothetical protein